MLALNVLWIFREINTGFEWGLNSSLSISSCASHLHWVSIMPSRLPALSMLGFTSKTSPLCYEDKASLSVSRFTKLAVCVRWTSMLICQQRTAAPHPAGAHTHPAPDNLEADGSHLKRRPAERIARATLPYAARGRRRAAHRVLLRAGRTPGPREGFDGLLGFGFTFFLSS